MFLGMHPDYRNNLDIANAVSTFGQFHSWNHNDPIKERALVYASFPSPQLVPRDVVFGKFGTVGGVRESWTAPVFILTADFADVLPADEDQMPLDGNPHPLPGALLPNNNLFVHPQFPEIGWDAVEGGQDDQDGQDNNADPQQENVDEEANELPESMALSMSNASSSSVNMYDGATLPLHHVAHPPLNVINIGMVVTRIGPVIPPDMQWRKVADWVLPALCFKTIPEAMKGSTFALLDLNKLPSAWVVTGMQDKHVEKWQGGLRVSLMKKDTATTSILRMKEYINLQGPEEGMEVTVTPLVLNKRAPRRAKSQLVQPAERRFTRSCLAEGYKPKPVLSVQPKIRKRSRAKLLIQKADEEEETKDNATEEKVEAEEVIPVTPVQVLQRVGLSLGIDPSKLTQDQLEAVPKKKANSDVKHD
jgi:hypothetical protein